MYVPKHFQMEDAAEILRFIRQHSFGILVSNDQDWPIATHIPVEVRTDAENAVILRGHVSKANPHWRAWEQQPQGMIIFAGAHSYVSSSWYNTDNVSTWNYVAVHAYGRLRSLTTEEIWENVQCLTNHYESTVENPKFFDRIAPEIVEKQIRGIAGFEMVVERFDAKAKLSQNRNDDDYHRVIAQLAQSDDAQAREIAHQMRQKRDL